MGRGDRSRSRERRSRSRDRRDRSRDRRRSPAREEKTSGRPEPKDDDTFRAGRQVIVKGLQKNPEKNGSIGQLIEFNAEKGRWSVAFAGGNNNFKEENLELMPDNSDVVDDNEEPPTSKIYITNLSAETTEKDILDLFGGCGVVDKEKPKDPRNRGFQDQWPYAVKLYKPGRDGGDAVLTYMDAFAAKAAIKTYNRYKFKGNKIGVAYAGQGRKYENVELQLPWHMREENRGKLDRDGAGGKGEGGKPERKPGDWVCSECGADVFASKSECFKCGAPKPDSGGGGGGGGRDRGDDRDRGGKDGGKDGGKGGGKGGKDWGKDDRGKGKGGKDRW